MSYFDEAELNEDFLNVENITSFYQSLDNVEKLDFFITLHDGTSIEDLMNSIHTDRVDMFSDENLNVEVVQYVTPDGQAAIICYEDAIVTNCVHINTNNKKEYKAILNNIFSAGDLITKITEKKNKQKYPYRFYGKYIILNNGNMLPITLS